MSKSKTFDKNKKNILYTGFGDKGTTTLYHCDQGRISKSANIIEALGSLDELNAYLGVLKFYSEKENLSLLKNKAKISYVNIIENIQQILFIIQANLAGGDTHVKKNDLNKIENIIEYISESIPPIKSFTLSGGSIVSSMFDFARTLARRSERRMIAVHDEGVKKLDSNTMAYLNRLSSLLFSLSRYTNYLLGIEEVHPHYNKNK